MVICQFCMNDIQEFIYELTLNLFNSVIID